MSARRLTGRCAIRLALAASGAALFVSTAQAQPVNETYGATVARRNCAQCHATGPVGDSPNVKAPRFRELHKRFVVQDLGERLLEQLMSHHADMPQFRLSMEELSGLIAYLKSIQTDRLSSGPPPASAQVLRAG